jgi:hypothetical protein
MCNVKNYEPVLCILCYDIWYSERILSERVRVVEHCCSVAPSVGTKPWRACVSYRDIIYLCFILVIHSLHLVPVLYLSRDRKKLSTYPGLAAHSLELGSGVSHRKKSSTHFQPGCSDTSISAWLVMVHK